jgi:4-azaleucine resistance transporter AzlC
MVPLWAGVMPFAAAFAILARGSGLSFVETMALSLILFAGSAQLAFVTLTASSAGSIAILLTTVLLNLRHVLYGLSLNTHLPRLTRPPRWLLAAFLTDEAYGLTMREFRAGRGSAPYLFGASLSLYLCFGTSTLIGALLGQRLDNLDGTGFEFIFPLSFLALLIPLLRSRADLIVAAISGGMALALSGRVDGGASILIASLAAAAIGTLLSRRPRS